MFKIWTVFAVLVLIESCTSKIDTTNKIIIYYENGNPKIIEDTLKGILYGFYDHGDTEEVAHYVNNELEGIRTKFYPENRLKFKGMYRNDKLLGKAYFWAKNGKLKYEGNYYDDLALGGQYYYDTTYDGTILKELFVPFKKNNVLVGKKKYKKTGEIIFDSSRVITTVKNKIIHLGDSIEVELEVLSPKYDRTRLDILNYDSFFHLIDSSGYIMIDGKGNKKTIKLKAQKKGLNFIRGELQDYKVEQIFQDGSISTLGRINNFFEVEYLVE